MLQHASPSPGTPKQAGPRTSAISPCSELKVEDDEGVVVRLRLIYMGKEEDASQYCFLRFLFLGELSSSSWLETYYLLTGTLQ